MEETSIKQLVMNVLEERDKRIDKRFEDHERRMDKQDDRIEKTDERVDKMNDIQIIHGQQIAGILETLKDIKGDTVWLRRTVTGAVIGGAISAIIGFIVFAIQKLN